MLIPVAVSYFEKVLQVVPHPGQLQPVNNSCDGDTIPQKYIDDGVDDTDLLILVFTDNLSPGTLAEAALCQYDSTTNR